MNDKIGRNDPCPCGSGKKYKQCCMQKQSTPKGKKKFTAKLISSGGMKKEEDLSKRLMQSEVNLMERTFGRSIAEASEENKPPIAVNPGQYLQKQEEE